MDAILDEEMRRNGYPLMELDTDDRVSSIGSAVPPGHNGTSYGQDRNRRDRSRRYNEYDDRRGRGRGRGRGNGRGQGRGNGRGQGRGGRVQGRYNEDRMETGGRGRNDREQFGDRRGLSSRPQRNDGLDRVRELVENFAESGIGRDTSENGNSPVNRTGSYEVEFSALADDDIAEILGETVEEVRFVKQTLAAPNDADAIPFNSTGGTSANAATTSTSSSAIPSANTSAPSDSAVNTRLENYEKWKKKMEIKKKMQKEIKDKEMKEKEKEKQPPLVLQYFIIK